MRAEWSTSRAVNFYDRLMKGYSEEDLSSAIANARILLVVAGGYDSNVTENIQYLKVSVYIVCACIYICQ